MSLKSYSMHGNQNIADIAVRDVTRYLLSLPNVEEVESVEKDKAYQKIDVDLLAWHPAGADGVRHSTKIEVKGDTYASSGNLFFEYISNSAKGTLGCFMYTEADYIYYAFPSIGTMYILKMPDTRQWFEDNITDFQLRETSTRAGSKILYTSYGFLVPIASVPEHLIQKVTL